MRQWIWRIKVVWVSRTPLAGHIFMWLVIFCNKFFVFFMPWFIKPNRTILARESSPFANTKSSRTKDCQKILLDMLNQSSCNLVNVTLSRRSSYCHSSFHLWMILVATCLLKWFDAPARPYQDVRSKRRQSFFEQFRTESAAARLSQELFRKRKLAWEGREKIFVVRE